MITYEKLWNLLGLEGLSQYYLIRELGLSPSVITRLRHNQSVTTHTLNSFCEILHCKLDDIVEYIRDERPNYVLKRKKSTKHK